MNAPPAILELRAIAKTFAGRPVLGPLSFSVAAGEVFGLLGPNGAGKSTTIGLVSGLLAPDAGSVSVAGHADPTRPAVRRRIGTAPQSLALYEELTGRENLAFVGRLYGLAGADLRRRVDEALAFVGLEARAGDRARTYSGGMARRLNLASALLHRPALLLLDEPMAGVDPQSRNLMLENIRTLRAGGTAVLYTTHYMEEAELLCDRVGVLDQGRLLALDSVPALIAAHGGASRIEVDDGNGTRTIETERPGEALLDLVRAGQGLRRLRVDHPSLETVFLNLTGRRLRDAA